MVFTGSGCFRIISYLSNFLEKGDDDNDGMQYNPWSDVPEIPSIPIFDFRLIWRHAYMLTTVWENVRHHMHVVVANKQLPLWHYINKTPAKPLIFQGIFVEGDAFVSYPIYQTSLKTVMMITMTGNLTHARINFIQISF